ncbi:MAG: peptidase U32 family protein [Bacteroidota bacterium]
MSSNQTNKPELLLPAGNIEAFHAALEAGADAVYLGGKHFNARERANNFTPAQLKLMTGIAHQQNARVYITLNTVIKNAEISELLDVLFQMEQIQPDAIIIQDWAVYHLAKRFFPSLSLHASTQMAFHNSIGSLFAAKAGLERVIMARELRKEELEKICHTGGAEIEIFVHGALCYSFSGMCLFSSYLGGMSANRGQCKQPCRRIYEGNEKGFLFSLKDNELISHIPEFSRLGVKSLKIEGRMKPAEYVYRVGRAYRLALDDHNKIPEAKTMLDNDLGREKTEYFMGGDVSRAITQAPATGKFLGRIDVAGNDHFSFHSDVELVKNSRLRIFSPGKSEHSTFKIKSFEEVDAYYTIFNVPAQVRSGDEIYLSDIPLKKFPNRFDQNLPGIKEEMPQKQKQKAIKKLSHKFIAGKHKTRLSYRIDTLAWLPKTDLRELEYLFINLSRKQWQEFKFDSPLVQKFKQKIVIELPEFIPENQLQFYKNLCHQAFTSGLENIAINHLSQKLLCNPGTHIVASEYVYSFSDVAIFALKEQGVDDYIRPLENDFNNLVRGNDRSGIIPLYFHPRLFISRMPVKTGDRFTERTGEVFLNFRKDGISHIVPENPVSLTQYHSKLRKAGFYRFLIDLSFTKPSSNRVKTISKRLIQSEQIQPASNFNFKQELT